ncbi:MAG: molybdate ABC transporter permease subunit [Verrucomicrobiota bacterium]
MESYTRLIWFTLAVAALAVLLILPPGIALAWALARKNWRGKAFVETIASLPLVMPPVATGLILLKLLGRKGLIGSWIENSTGLQVVFTWKAVVIALAVMSFPLLVRTARVAFEQVNARLEQVARTLGASSSRVFFTITLPLAWRGVVGGAVLAFARALGEFGATMLVAGAIPGKTQTLSVSIYHLIQLGEDRAAGQLLLISIAFSFGALLLSEFLIQRRNVDRAKN